MSAYYVWQVQASAQTQTRNKLQQTVAIIITTAVSMLPYCYKN